jgi:hypothetical protein
MLAELYLICCVCLGVGLMNCTFTAVVGTFVELFAASIDA